MVRIILTRHAKQRMIERNINLNQIKKQSNFQII